MGEGPAKSEHRQRACKGSPPTHHHPLTPGSRGDTLAAVERSGADRTKEARCYPGGDKRLAQNVKMDRQNSDEGW